jgi:hypothetical protein
MSGENVSEAPAREQTSLFTKVATGLGVEILVNALGRAAAKNNVHVSLNVTPAGEAFTAELASTSTPEDNALDELKKLSAYIATVRPGEEQPTPEQAVDEAIRMLSLHWPRG